MELLYNKHNFPTITITIKISRALYSVQYVKRVVYSNNLLIQNDTKALLTNNRTSHLFRYKG